MKNAKTLGGIATVHKGKSSTLCGARKRAFQHSVGAVASNALPVKRKDVFYLPVMWKYRCNFAVITSKCDIKNILKSSDDILELTQASLTKEDNISTHCESSTCPSEH
ncbi:Uncharacterized protein Fot_21740 [Forsythia ovata]|uniref:Uncharacterized protein n=1 Tax=Forsythia ovata TaxID=205694 RepID=A0ABD1UVP5_9LAMI